MIRDKRIQPDHAEIRRALGVLTDPGDVIEIRAPKCGRRGTISGYYNDIEKAAEDAVKISRMADGTYITINRLSPDLLARRANRFEEHASPTTSDDPSQVTRRLWLFIDCDAQRPSGISATDAEKAESLKRAEEVRAYLDAEGWPEPVMCDSGNGAHLLFRIDLVNDDDAKRIVEGCLGALDVKFSDDKVKIDKTVSNASRICKLPGTTTHKGDNTPDRPHRNSRLLHVPDPIEIVPRAKLEALGVMIPKPEPSRPARQFNGDRFDVPAYLAEHNIEIRSEKPYRDGRMWILDTCPLCGESDGAAFVTQFADGALAAGCHHNRCEGKGWHDFRDAVEPDWRERRQDRPTLPDPSGFVESEFIPLVNEPYCGHTPQATDSGRQKRPEKEFPGMPLSQLMKADLEVRFLIEGILAADQAAVIAGPQKSLKTSIMLDMVLALSQAGYFLGRFPVHEAKRVGVMTAEIGFASVRNTLERICRAAGIDPNDVENLVITDQVPMIGRLPDQGALRRFCLDHELEFLAVDPLYMCLDGENQSNTAAQGQQLREFSAMCQEVGCTVLFAHHTKRETSRIYEPLDLGHLHGAGLPEFVRQWVLVSRRVPYVAGSGLHELHMVVGGSVGHEGLWGLNIDEGHRDDPGGRRWAVDVLPYDELQQDAARRRQARAEETRAEKIGADSKAIVNTMVRFPDGETKTAIRDATGLSGQKFNTAFASLIQAGDVVPCEVQKSNRRKPYEAYKLAN